MRSQKFVFGILLSIAIVALIYGFLSFGRSILTSKKPVSDIIPSPTPSPQTSPSASPTPVNTTGWKTYTNTKYFFTFKYPDGFEVVRTPDYDSNNSVQDLAGISIDGHLQFVANYDVSLGCLNIAECAEIALKGSGKTKDEVYEVKRLLGDVMITGYGYHGKITRNEDYLVERNGHIFRVYIFYNDARASSSIDDILSTFRFRK